MSFTDNLIYAIQETSPLEWIAVICGIAYVLLAAYRKLACWFFGLISSAIYVYLCFISKLYIETGLQIFYVVMSFYGWITWNAQQGHIIKIRMRSFQFHIYALAIGLVMAFLLGYFFEKNTDQASAYLDASIGVFSLIATFMTANRVLENWIYWIVVDFAAIFLYASRDLALSAVLYVIFTVMAIYALIQWTKQYRSQKEEQHKAEYLKSNINS
jgi:nicotinamide mononucleotide transporter